MRSSLSILFTVHGYKPAYRIGGPIISVSSLAEALVKKGHKVQVFTTNSNLIEDLDVPVDCPQWIEGVEVWYFQRKELLKKIFPFVPYISQSIGFLYAPAMRHQLDKTLPHVDLVHLNIPFNYPTYAAAKAAKKHKKPFFYSQRGIFDPVSLSFRSLKKRFYLKLIERPILYQATTLIALTQYEVQNYRRLCNSTPCNIIPNGIDVDKYITKPKNANVLNIHPESFVILFLGRLHPTKGTDKLIEAFFHIYKNCPDTILILAGTDEINMEKEFRDRIAQKDLNKRIIFPGMITGQAKLDLLARANLFCLPSNAEGFSMAILEALASETMVMISPGCHFPEVERAGVGKVVAADSEKMAKTIVSLINNKDTLFEMGKKGRKYVELNFSWDVISDKLINVYHDGITRHLKKMSSVQMQLKISKSTPKLF